MNSESDQIDPRPSAPHPELARLDPLVGEWEVVGETRESLAGPAGTVTSRETFHWLDGGYFLVSTWVTVFADAPPQKGIMYWGYDAAAERFRTHFFDNQGPFHEGSTYEGEVVDGALVFTGPARFRFELDADGKIEVDEDGTFVSEWQLQDGDGMWKPWMHNAYARVT